MRFLTICSVVVLGSVLVAIVQVDAWRSLTPDAGYREKCDAGHPCDVSKNLTCSEEVCECKHDEVTHSPWYYHEPLGGCIPTIRDHPHHVHDHNENGDDEVKAPKSDSEALPHGESVYRKPCQNDYVCTRNLGPSSRCFQGNCECYDTVSSGKWPTVYFQEKCVLKKKEGEPCDLPIECQAEHKDLECVVDNINPPHSKCTCPNNKKCTVSDSGSSGIIFSVILISVTFLANRILS